MITVIFDIDGTLVDSMRFDVMLYMRALKQIMGEVKIHDDWRKYRYITDSGIVSQVIEENGVTDPEGMLSHVRRHFGELVSAHLESHPCRPVAGAVSAVADLYGNKEYKIGFATGGWRHTALMKLKSAGFSFDEAALFSSDDHLSRSGIMERCRQAISPGSNDIVYVGDGEWDLEAAKELGWGFVGIGDRLKDKTEVWIEDFHSENWKAAPMEALRRIHGTRGPVSKKRGGSP